MTEKNEYLTSLVPEIEAHGLGDRIAELGADGPVGIRDLIGFRFGLADGAPVPSPGNPKGAESPREGIAQKYVGTPGYDIGIRAAKLLTEKGRMAA